MMTSVKALPALLLTLLLSACGEQEAAIYGTVERDRLTLTAPTSEPVTEILVREGDRVNAGAPLLRLDDRAALARVAEAKANQAQAEARLAELLKGARDETLAQARARLQGADATVNEAEAQYARVARLVAQEVQTAADLDRAQANRKRALAEQALAAQSLKELIAGTRSEQLAQASAVVDATKAQLALAQKQLSDLTLVASRAAVVELLPWRVGDRVGVGSQLVGLMALDSPYVRAYLPAPALTLLQPGSEVRVRVDDSSEPLVGRVRTIRSEPAFTPFYALNERDRARLMYLTDIDLPQDSVLPSGLAVEVILPGSEHD